MVEHDYNTGRVIKTLKDLGIAENTLVIWNSDNGPMYTVHPHGGYSLLPGGKGETREGGIRVPAIAWWPGMIEPGQEPIDLVQITDWFTTIASLADAKDRHPGRPRHRRRRSDPACCCWARARAGATTSSTTTGRTWRPYGRIRSRST